MHIIKYIIIFIITFFGLFISQNNITNAAIGDPVDSSWNLIGSTQTNHFKLLKGIPFKFSFYNKLYNYFRLTDNGALVFGVSPDNPTISEGFYLEDKNNARIKVLPGESVEVTFKENKTKVVLPAGKRYININGQYNIADGSSYLDVKGNQVITLNNGEEITLNNGLYGIEVNDESKLEDISDSVLFTSAGVNSYVMATPGFIDLDMSRHDEHGMYEKEFLDSKGDVYAVGYLWYGYIEGTTQQVQYGVVLYNAKYYNNIRFFYGEIDGTIDKNIFAGLSNGNGADVVNIPYSGQELGNLSLQDDIMIDGSKTYQEVSFQIGYEPPSSDPNDNLLLDYEERGNSAPFPFIDKPESSYVALFDVEINSDKVVCQREYVTSDGGDTLRWGKLSSSRTDFDDIDTFCFSAETPGMVVLDNASYAKGGYKTGQSECVVSHLSVMGFNAQSIGWNTRPANNCWLTYKIQSVEKDLSLANTNPYNLLGRFVDDIDLRPVDDTIVMNNKSIQFTDPKPIRIVTDSGVEYIADVIPDFKPIKLKMISTDNMFLFGTDGTDTYVLYTSNRGDRWQVIHKETGKELSFATTIDNVILLFFTDGTYVRNSESGSGNWKLNRLEGYTSINDIGFISNRSGIMIGNEGKIWRTSSAGDTFELVDLKASLNLQGGENLQSIDIYGASDIWISTNRGTILYSANGGNSFVKRSAGTTLDYEFEIFQDATSVYKDKMGKNTTGTNVSGIDKDEETKSVKFANDYQYMRGCSIWGDNDNPILSLTENKTNLSSFVVTEQNRVYPKGDLYLEYYISTNGNNGLDTIRLEDDYGNYILVEVDKIFDANGEQQKQGWNKVKVEMHDILNESEFYSISAPSDTTGEEQHFKNISKYYLTDTTNGLSNGEKIGLSKIEFAPISNLGNVSTINIFDDNLTDNENRTCKNTLEKDMVEMIDGVYDLQSFTSSNGELPGFLTLDIYVEDRNKWNIGTIELGNSENQKIIWNDVKQFSGNGKNVINNGWNTFILPFDNDGVEDDIEYTIQPNNINYGFLRHFKINANSGESDVYNKYALTNLRYSSVANTNLKHIHFFNRNEGIAFSDNATFVTNNNSEWSSNNVLGQGNNAETSVIDTQKIKGREVYAIGNDENGWFSYYSLDKGRNNKTYYSDSGINLTGFDMINFDDGLAISEDSVLYNFTLAND